MYGQKALVLKKSKRSKKDLSISIKGITWQYELLEKDVYKTRHPGSEAMCDKSKRLLSFSKEFLTKEHIAHELGHGYISSCMVDTASLSHEDFEEVACEIISHHLDDIQRHRDEIYKKLKGRKK